MKKKLQKDLRFLKKVWVRVIIAPVIAIAPGFIMILQGGQHEEENAITTWIVSTFLFFIGLYFFIAWLYGDEEVTNS